LNTSQTKIESSQLRYIDRFGCFIEVRRPSTYRGVPYY